MKLTISKFWAYIKPKTTMELHEDYLSKASDLCDLERRMKQLDKGTAPFQTLFRHSV